MSCNSNGRVNILGENHMNCFQLYDKIPVSGGDTYYKTAMVGNWQNTTLSNLFFSKENIMIIQNGIRAGVYNKSNKRFQTPKSECYFWLNHYFIKGNFKHKKWRRYFIN